MKDILIGVDVGTSGTKAAVVDLSGRVQGEGFCDYPLYSPENGWAEQDAGDWEQAVYNVVFQAIAISGIQAKRVGGICVSGLFAGSGVPVGEDMRPLRNAIIWMDRRAVAQSDLTRGLVPEEELFAVTGNRNDAYFGFNKIIWIRDNEPELWTKIKFFLPSNSFIAYCLTGEVAVDYTAAANIGGVYDAGKSTWSKAMMEKLGIPFSFFPKKLVKPDKIVGYLTNSAADKMGLPFGIPVCAGCTDCLASVISMGVTREGIQTAVIGTSINWGILHRNAPADSRLVTMPFVADPFSLRYTYGGISSAGVLCKWFKDTIAPFTERQGKVIKTEFYMLEEEALSTSPGSDGLLVLPYFMGERSPVWDSDARGVFCGLSLKHTRGHMYRAILESLCYAIRHIREMSPELFGALGGECIVSGGACHSALWMQLLADITGTKIITTDDRIQAPVGDALIAGVATGLIASYTEAETWCRYGNVYFPEAKTHLKYEPFYQEYKQLYESTLGIIHRLANGNKLNDQR